MHLSVQGAPHPAGSRESFWGKREILHQVLLLVKILSDVINWIYRKESNDFSHLFLLTVLFLFYEEFPDY